ncbi:MAG: hypothetical protein ACE5HS_09625 [bacterium]
MKKSYLLAFAKVVIDTDAGMFIAHGERIFDGLEIYKGRPIFRQFGGFSYQGFQSEGSYPMFTTGAVKTVKKWLITSEKVLNINIYV